MTKAILVFILLSVCLAHAQVESSSSENSVDSRQQQQDIDELDGKPDVIPDPTEPSPLEVKTKVKDAEWVVAPIPNYSPSQEWGVALVAQRIFGHREDEKPTMAVGSIFGTEKKSYGGVLGYLGHFNEDRLRVNVFGGYLKLNTDFYGIGKDQSEKDISVLLEEEVTFVTIQILPRWGSIYIGPTLAFNQIKNKFDIEGIPDTVDLGDKFDRETWIPGLKLQVDQRDNMFYPMKGYISTLTAQFFDERFGGEKTFQRYKGYYNHYFHLWDEDVLATRVAFQANIGEVSFYDMATFGRGPDLRGYKAGKYRDKIDWAMQAEYRTRFSAHWGAVVFAGFGDVVAKASELTLKDLLWSEGVGLRYRIGAQNPVDFRLDAAYGEDWAWYFSVNQAF